MKEAQGWLNQNPFWVSNICRVETIFLLAAHICSILKTGNYHLRWWDAIHTAMMLAGCPGSPCAALSVTVSVLIYAKARSGRWRRDPIWTGSQQSLNSILWVEYFDRVPDFQVLVLVIALVTVLIVFVAGFFSNKLFYFFCYYYHRYFSLPAAFWVICCFWACLNTFILEQVGMCKLY